MKELHPEYDYMDTPDRDEFMNDQDDSTLDGIEAQTNLVTPAPAQAEDVAMRIANDVYKFVNDNKIATMDEFPDEVASIIRAAIAPLVQRAELADTMELLAKFNATKGR